MFEDFLAARQSYIQKNHIEAYRLVPVDSCKFPIAIDIYKDNAVIHCFETLGPDEMKEVEQELRSLLGIHDFFYKNRAPDKGAKNETHAAVTRKEITITEYGNRFSINLSDYLDTGLFLDHRETRKWIGGLCKGKTVLNTFAYTSSFTVYAAQGGAVKTHSVDLSKTYCEWTKKNFSLNNMALTDHWVFKMDTFEYFHYAKRKKLTFDIIILDPPTFSRSKEGSFSLQKDHPRLIAGAMEILAPGGFIFFSNNFKGFEMKEERLDGCRIREKFDTIPIDFEDSIPHCSYVITRK